MTSFGARCQNDTLSFEEQFALLEAEMDSLSIFYMIDSVLTAADKKSSELNLRLSYNSNVLNAGRNYGLDQHGIAPGVSFYHRTGWYADYSGYWSNQMDPRFNLSVLSGGYLGTIGDHWSVSATYERWHYHGSKSENSFANSLGGSLTYNTRIGYASVDYGYLFGGASGAHRIIGSLTGTISLGKWWIFQSMTLLPSASVYFGNQEVLIRFEGELLEELRSNEYLQQNLSADELRQYLTDEDRRQIQSISQNSNLTSEQKRRGIMLVFLSNPDVQGYIYSLLDRNENQYGIMNYSFSLPLLLSTPKWNFFLSYTYSIPVQLPGEAVKLDPVGYLGASVSYRISFTD